MEIKCGFRDKKNTIKNEEGKEEKEEEEKEEEEEEEELGNRKKMAMELLKNG